MTQSINRRSCSDPGVHPVHPNPSIYTILSLQASQIFQNAIFAR